MVSNSLDRFNGYLASLAIKAPCRTVALTNITLSGEQTVNSVAVVTGDRVLVAGQTDATENGIYEVSTGAWQRAPDFDGSRDVTQGTLISVISSSGQAALFEVTTANPITIGSSSLAFSARYAANTTYDATAAETASGVTITDSSQVPGNAKRYGATGDGSTNDQAALQAWINSGESHLTLPAGTYILTTGIAIPETSAVGKMEGLGMPVLKRDDSVTPTTTILSVYDENKVEISGIRFDGNQTGNAPVGTPSEWGDVAVIATLTASPNTNTQLDYWVTFSNCEFVDSPGTCVAGAGMQNTLIQNCRFEDWMDHAVYCNGDDGTSRGLGTNVIVDNCIFYNSQNGNDACKVSNNSRRYTISNNLFELSSDSCMQVTPGSANSPREVVFIGNAGSASSLCSFSGATNSPNTDQAHYLFADNNMALDTRGFYLGDTVSSTFQGHLHVRGGSYRNSFAGWKSFLDARFFDNANGETSITLDGVYFKDFGIQQGDWPQKFVMKNCVCDETAAAWFFPIGSDDSVAKHIVIEGNQFLNPATNQGNCGFKINEDSTLIIRENTYIGDGIAMNLQDTHPEVVIFEGNTLIDVQGILFNESAAIRGSVGTMTVANNRAISTVGSSVNARLIEESTSGNCLLDSYNVFVMNNYFRDVNVGLRSVGTGVTTYAGSNIYYANGNYGVGSAANAVSYPAASLSSFLPHLQVTNEYAPTNDVADRAFDANASTVAELADVLATLLKDLGHGA